MADVPNEIVNAVHKELKNMFPNLTEGESFTEDLIRCVEETGRKFVFIIDEWDALIREAKNEADIQAAYFNLLREWFKNGSFTSKVVAAAYMTGILPIKKDGSQSAISDFTEYSILDPGEFAEFTGFTENEVKGLCERHGMNFKDAKSWYDGYDFPEVGAIGQIKERNYPAVIQDYGGEIVLVGINYDEKTKEHSCLIERVY